MKNNTKYEKKSSEHYSHLKENKKHISTFILHYNYNINSFTNCIKRTYLEDMTYV